MAQLRLVNGVPTNTWNAFTSQKRHLFRVEKAKPKTYNIIHEPITLAIYLIVYILLKHRSTLTVNTD